jgi:sugar transferase EpsL
MRVLRRLDPRIGHTPSGTAAALDEVRLSPELPRRYDVSSPTVDGPSNPSPSDRAHEAALPKLSTSVRSLGGTSARAKRAIDVAVVGVAVTLLAPLMAVVALAIRLTMGRPILFRQMRPGYRGRPFQLVKFRSMREGIDPYGRPLPVNQRITRLGSFLRKTSLDELPELTNVLRGDMSLVGPRPLIMEYMPLYTPEQARRHEVKPGLTGLAQVSGRHLLEWEERFRLDVWYVDNWSISLDLRILARTVTQVIRGKGLPPPTADDYSFHGTQQKR